MPFVHTYIALIYSLYLPNMEVCNLTTWFTCYCSFCSSSAGKIVIMKVLLVKAEAIALGG